MAYETEKYRHLTLPYITGNVIDLGSGGCPVVPHAIQVELPPKEFAHYTSGSTPMVEPQWRGSALDLPFKDGVVDTVYSSHLLEDMLNWEPVLREWVRVLKSGGNLIIMVPDKELWAAALAKGQPPNCAHKHEAYPGEISQMMAMYGLPVRMVKDELTRQFEGDFNILYVGTKW